MFQCDLILWMASGNSQGSKEKEGLIQDIVKDK